MSIEVPKDLNEAGRAAFNYVVGVLGPDKSAAMYGHIERYAKACQVADAYYKEWLNTGSPVTILGGSTGRQTIANPVLVSYLDAEKTAGRFLAELGIVEDKTRGGRPAGTKNSKTPSKVTRKESPNA